MLTSVNQVFLLNSICIWTISKVLPRNNVENYIVYVMYLRMECNCMYNIHCIYIKKFSTFMTTDDNFKNKKYQE